MQTILDAGGAIGKTLAKEILKYDANTRLVSRHPSKINESDELMAGNITNKTFVEKAVEGSEIVYLAAGLKYNYKVWLVQWPLIIQNVLDACKKSGSKLVFFDNAYMYDPMHLENLTEETSIRPVSKKGKLRAADFYGPLVNTSVMIETVYKRMNAGKKPMWLGNPDAYHSMTYTIDAAKATALLANTTDTYQQVWHLPTEMERLTGRQWVQQFSKEMNKPEKFISISGKLTRLIGVLVPFFMELGEMMYQFDNNYFFNCEKFKGRFPGFEITSPEKGVREVVNVGR
ncbi:MAG: NAD(P)H-binding protein [Bacteroidetes bacterium]|nr:NAD(P)H-binding protein [Bacteroidota bacterium]